ncbi:MAG: hypothetical protein ACOC9P_00170 [bacterium]
MADVREVIRHCRSPSPGLTFHSDASVQHTLQQFRTLLDAHGGLQSMSRKGDCYDHAPMESWIGTLKHELMAGEPLGDRAEARLIGFEYTKSFKSSVTALITCFHELRSP